MALTVPNTEAKTCNGASRASKMMDEINRFNIFYSPDWNLRSSIDLRLIMQPVPLNARETAKRIVAIQTSALRNSGRVSRIIVRFSRLDRVRLKRWVGRDPYERKIRCW